MSSSFCTFSNNVAQNYNCIWLQKNSGTITYTNFIANNSPTGGGIVYVCINSSYSLSNCIFAKNQHTLFWASSTGGSLYVTNSYISHTSNSITLGPVITSNGNVFTLTLTYALSMYSTPHCNADIPIFQIEATCTIARTYDERCSIPVDSIHFQDILHVFSYIMILPF